MRNVFETARWVAGLAVLTLAIASCGGSDLEVGTGTGVSPSRGVFSGETSAGGSIEIEVGSIESLTFECDDTRVRQIFVPPGHVDIDGTFDLRFSTDGRQFRFKGQFTSDNFVEGSISDSEHVCDVVFAVCRKTPVESCGASTPSVSGTPTRTPSPIPSPTRTATPVVEPTGPTSTPGPDTTTTRTATPEPDETTTRTPTPEPTATPFCGDGVKDTGEDCDTGATFGGSDATDCAAPSQCACCYCRPDIGAHAGPNMSACSGCHASGLVPKPPKPGAVATFGAKCE